MIAVLVREYDEAIRFYTNKLGFELLEDTDLGMGKRWVRIAPPGEGSAEFLLARAVDAEQSARVGNQTGGRVFFFLETDDIERDYRLMINRGVEFMESPRVEPYGKVAVFLDLYGNKADLIEPI
ncbi:hypothetical protein B7486_02645 [cyanobacterium TDX16]|nr:hypothetical protein B7486_02645 [cyanobacterium TDX16]